MHPSQPKRHAYGPPFSGSGARGHLPLLLATVLILLPFAHGLADTPPATAPAASAKKLIYYGWGSPDTAYLKEHLADNERGPFDGVGLVVAIDRGKPVRGDDTTPNRLGWNLWGPRAFKLEDFRPAIEDLRAAKSAKLTDNFLAAAICSRGQDSGFDWFDDKRWETVKQNWRVFATIAKQGGCKGLLIDPEHYSVYFFRHDEMRVRNDKPFAEYAAKVRQRGRELMTVTREAFGDDVVILCLFGHSLLWHNVRDKDNAKAVKPLELTDYGLYAPFLDGMLEATAPATRIVDGYEFAYGFEDHVNFERAREEIRHKAALVSEQRERYEKQVEVGFGVWIDNGQKWNQTNFKANHFSPEALEAALRSALDVTDRYVWLYSEKPEFFPLRHVPPPYLNAIERSKSPGPMP
jgi:hypothetical protein